MRFVLSPPWSGSPDAVAAVFFFVPKTIGRVVCQHILSADPTESVTGVSLAVTNTSLVSHAAVRTIDRVARSGAVGLLRAGSLTIEFPGTRFPVATEVLDRVPHVTVVMFVRTVTIGSSGPLLAS